MINLNNSWKNWPLAFEMHIGFLKEDKNFLMACGIFNKKQTRGKKHPLDLARIACVAKASNSKQLRILTPKWMLLNKRLQIAIAQVKADNKSEKLLNKFRQIIDSLYRAKEITKKVYNKINQINTIFMNSKNSETYEPHRLFITQSYRWNKLKKKWQICCSSKS